MIIIENAVRSQFILDTPADRFLITHVLTKKTYNVGLTQFMIALPPYESVWDGGYSDSTMYPGLDGGDGDDPHTGDGTDAGDSTDLATYTTALWGGSIYYGLMGDFSELDPGEYAYRAYLGTKLVQRGLLKIKDHLRPTLNQKSNINIVTYKA